MKRVLTEIEIGASVERVWQVLADTARWPEWNPVISSVRGRVAVGSRVTIFLRLDPRVPVPLPVTITEFTPGKALVWSGGSKGIFVGTHGFRLESKSSLVTRVSHGETFDGAVTHAMFAPVLDRIAARYELLNRALRDRCERA